MGKVHSCLISEETNQVDPIQQVFHSAPISGESSRALISLGFGQSLFFMGPNQEWSFSKELPQGTPYQFSRYPFKGNTLA